MSERATPPRSGFDPYALDPAEVTEPPQGLGPILRKIGPGIILASAIVGSGELIATTTLGAEVGYAALWVILLACFLKPAIQAEIGRHTIATGETGLAGFNEVPGPRARVNWVVWCWAGLIFMTRFNVGAMFGGVAQVLNILIPGVPITAWVLLLLVLTYVLLLGGGYQRIEKLSMVMVGLFTLVTFLAAVVLTRRPEDFALIDVVEGLKFHLPAGGLASAIAVFGITGVGSSEMFTYPYWCVEKGYARYVGKYAKTPVWRSRALGWIRVMHVDILASMVIYTVATIAFYLLGAGILHSRGLVPNATEMIPRLAAMYTETLGPWAIYVFYAGALATLYGTIFAATAADSRIGADLVRLLGGFDRADHKSRVFWRNIFVFVLPGLAALFFLVFRSPVNMVKAGGIGQATMLPVIAIGALYMRYRRLPREVIPKTWITVWLWTGAISAICLMTYYVVLSLR